MLQHFFQIRQVFFEGLTGHDNIVQIGESPGFHIRPDNMIE